MKILHISTYDKGGAANAAIRLHTGLVEKGIDSNFLTLYSNNKMIPQVWQHQYTFKEKVLEYARIKLGLQTYFRDIKLIDKQAKQKKLEAATMPVSNFDITRQKVYQKADIINLHWTSGYLDYTSFFKKNKKPIVWTLHDMNPFSGIYHYQGDSERNAKLLGQTDYKANELKSKVFRKAKINVVCPSRWLLEASQSSELFHHFQHTYIPYGLDTDLFKPQDQMKAREALSLPMDKKILLFVSQNVHNYRKGFDLLHEAVQLLKDDNSLLLVAVGKIPKNRDTNIHYIGTIREETTMAQAYAAADAFVLPSREDNLPNVMLESLACGTPVICFPVGGMPDAIEPGFNGIFASEVTSEALSKTINKYIKSMHQFDRLAIRKDAVARFALKYQVKRYQQLYQSLV